MIVVDASVILKWVLPDETDQERAEVLLQRHVSGTEVIVAPDLLMYEVSNVLSLRWGDPQKVSEGFRRVCDVEVQCHPFGLDAFIRSIELSTRYRITTYDACYVALAQALRCRFITADNRLLSDLKGVPHILHLKEAV